MKKILITMFLIFTLSGCIRSEEIENQGTCKENEILINEKCIIDDQNEDTTVEPSILPPVVSIKTIGDITTQVMIKINITDETESLIVDHMYLTDQSGFQTEYNSTTLLTINNLTPLSTYTFTVYYHYMLNNQQVDDQTEIRFNTTSNTLNYFKEIALGFEFGTASEVTRKWIHPMHIYLDGTVTDDIQNELDRIIEELNSLFSDGFYIDTVENINDSNFIIFLGSGEVYSSRYNVSSSYTDTNWGLFFIDLDNQENIKSGHMYVDIYRADRIAQLHLLREELTQSLGLAKDSDLYPNSMFYGKWTTTLSYAQIDKELIYLLYSDIISSGLNSEEIEEILTPIIQNGIVLP